jgi:hypothetical protein
MAGYQAANGSFLKRASANPEERNAPPWSPNYLPTYKELDENYQDHTTWNRNNGYAGIQPGTPTRPQIAPRSQKGPKKIVNVPYGMQPPTGGKVMVYTGPKNGKYIIKNGSKVYINRKSLSNNFQYKKGAKSKK